MKKIIAPTAWAIFVAASAHTNALAQAPTPTGAPALPVATAASPPYQFDRDKYVRLEVNVSIPGGDSIDVGDCPTQLVQQQDLASVLRTDKTASLGLSIAEPSDTTTVPPLQITVADVTYKNTFLGHHCSIATHQLQYTSPFFSMKRYESRVFTVTFNTLSEQKPGDLIQQAISAAVIASASVAGVTAPVAQPFATAAVRVVDGLKIDNTKAAATDYKIGADATITSQRIPVTGILSNGKAIMVDVHLVSQDAIVIKPSVGGWNKDAVYNSSFPIPATAATNATTTLGDYLENKYSKDIGEFRQAKDAAAANLACTHIQSDLIAVGLTPKDEAMALWAVTRSQGTLADGDVDHLACLASSFQIATDLTLGQASHSGTGATTPPSPTAPAAPPTTSQMVAALDPSDILADFFILGGWDTRKTSAQAIYAYPVIVTDPDKVLFNDGTSAPSYTVSDADGWLALIDRSKPIVPRVGCYTYFDENKQPQLPSSFAYVIADAKHTDGATTAKDQVYITLTFAPTGGTGTAAALVNKVSVSKTVDASLVKTVRDQHQGQCAGGWRPPVLKGR